MPLACGSQHIVVVLRCRFHAAGQNDLHDEFGEAVFVQLPQKPLQTLLHLRIADFIGGAFDYLVPTRQCLPAQRFHPVEHGAGDENKVGAVERCAYLFEHFSKDAMAHNDFDLRFSISLRRCSRSFATCAGSGKQTWEIILIGP